MADTVSSGVAAPPVIDTASLPASTSAASSSLWDRASRWASDNKAAVYTIAGVTVVVSAGAIYYMSSSQPKLSEEAAADRKKLRKDKKKAKKEAERGPVLEKKAEEGMSIDDLGSRFD